MEEALIEVPTMRRFTGIELISDRIPDETTILTFRHLLEKHGLGEQVFETVKAHLNEKGMTMRQGTLPCSLPPLDPRLSRDSLSGGINMESILLPYLNTLQSTGYSP